MKKKKIAIIGSGFFGLSCAIILSKKYKVEIYEIKDTILCGASRANQMRFHLGYHYPRSGKTVNEINKHYTEFLKFYGNSVLGKTINFYGISKKYSKINFKNYLKFLNKWNLKYKISNQKEFTDNIEGQVLSQEKILNFFEVKKKIKQKILQNNIKIKFNTTFKKKEIKNYDKIILATYDQNNKILNNLGFKPKKSFKYELVEKIIIKLPKEYKDKSYMVLDGKFICIDPYLGTKYHLLSDVKSSKLEIVKSKFPLFKNYKKKFLNKGIIKNKKISNYDIFLKNGLKYLSLLNKSKYIGSFFVTRALQINKEKTDERLNEISKHGNKIISIFSGKWNTCVGVARNVSNIIDKDLNYKNTQ